MPSGVSPQILPPLPHNIQHVEIPKYTKKDEIIAHTAFTISEELIESMLNLKNWGFDGSKSAEELEIGKSVLCKGVTRNGERCKNRTKDTEGCCHIHEDRNNKDHRANIYKRIN